MIWFCLPLTTFSVVTLLAILASHQAFSHLRTFSLGVFCVNYGAPIPNVWMAGSNLQLISRLKFYFLRGHLWLANLKWPLRLTLGITVLLKTLVALSIFCPFACFLKFICLYSPTWIWISWEQWLCLVYHCSRSAWHIISSL